MKKLFKGNILSIVLLGLSYTLHGAASSSTANRLSDREHGQFIILYDRHENAERGPISVVKSLADVVINTRHPFMVNARLVNNFLIRNARAEKRDICCSKPVDWNAWDVYKVPGEGFLYFVPKAYIQEHPNHGLLLRAEDSVSSDPKSLMDAVQKRESEIFNINILRHVFQLRSKPKIQPHERNQSLNDREEQEPSIELLQEQQRLPIWDIVLNGHGSLANIDAPAPEESTVIAGISVKKMKEVFKFFANELYVSTVLIQTCSVGGRNANLLQFDRAIGNNTLLSLNFAVILASVSDELTTGFNVVPKWNVFLTLAASAAPLGSMLKALDVDPVGSHWSPHASSNIPQVWIPGGYGFQTYQVDDRVKILSKVFVAAREDEQRTINIPNTTEVVLVYPTKIDVPVKIGLFNKPWDRGGSDWRIIEYNLRTEAWIRVPSVVELLAELPEATISSLQDAPALAGLKMKHANFKQDVAYSKYYIYPGFVSMLKSADNQHTFNRIELAVALSENAALADGVMTFIRDAFVPSLITGSEIRQMYTINELTGNNDISLLLELVRAKEGGDVSELETAMRPFIGKKITLENVVVRSVPKMVKKVIIKFQFQGVTWRALVDYSGKSKKIGWKFFPSDVVHGTSSSQEEKQLSISEALKKRIAVAAVKETPVMVAGKPWVDPGMGTDPRAKDPQVSGALGSLYRGFVYMRNSPFSDEKNSRTFLNAIKFAAHTGDFRSLEAFAARFHNVSFAGATLSQWIALAKKGEIPVTAGY